MRIILSLAVLLTLVATSACEYAPASHGQPALQTASPENPPQHGDAYFETMIGRYDLAADR